MNKFYRIINFKIKQLFTKNIKRYYMKDNGGEVFQAFAFFQHVQL